MRKCVKCGKTDRYKDGRCAPCNREGMASWSARNPTNGMLRKAKWRAKRDGVPFNLMLGDLEFPEFCPVLGIPLKRSAGQFDDSSPTIDRKIPSLGYVMGNVAIISHRANRLKGDATLLELELLVLWLGEQR